MNTEPAGEDWADDTLEGIERENPIDERVKMSAIISENNLEGVGQ